MAGPELTPVQELSAATALSLRSGLCALLKDVVDGGASVGFLPPLDGEEAGAYWDGVAAALEGGGRRLWIARDTDGGIVGSVQLDLAAQANGGHRASASAARRLGRTTLVLDTRQGDPSEALYRRTGWQPGGTIPRYARSADGTLHTTAVYYKLL